MRQAVANKWLSINSQWEGYLPYMYLDVRGLVTTGMGNLIDPISLATALPWQRADGSPASQSEIVAAWQAVKARTDLESGYGQAYAQVTSLRLSKEAINALVLSVLLVVTALAWTWKTL